MELEAQRLVGPGSWEWEAASRGTGDKPGNDANVQSLRCLVTPLDWTDGIRLL